MKIYCDSSLQESCYVIDSQAPVILPYDSSITVNEGEYLSVIRALDYLYRNNSSAQIYTDSQLLVRQIKARQGIGKYRTLNRKLFNLGTLVLKLLSETKSNLHWTPREYNPAGIALEEISQGRKK